MTDHSPQHSPLPWRVEYERDNENETDCGHIAIMCDDEDNDGYHVARVWGDGKSPSDDAALIVRAVNSHKELVEALRDLLDTAYVYRIGSADTARARAALEKAGQP